LPLPGKSVPLAIFSRIHTNRRTPRPPGAASDPSLYERSHAAGCPRGEARRSRLLPTNYPYHRAQETATLVARAVVDSSQDAFSADVIDASNAAPVIVDFHAAWCGPCKLVAPSMVWADKEYDGKLKVVKIDCTDGNKELMEQYKVYGLPCLIMFKDGAMMDGSLREGAITKKGLAEYVEKWTGLSAAV